MAEEFKVGDRVQWKTSQGNTTGIVKQKITSPTEIKGHHVAASEDNPEYLVESDKTGKEAAHKPDALEKI
jgi:Hypervirulence associated proteins TUDOR domain